MSWDSDALRTPATAYAQTLCTIFSGQMSNKRLYVIGNGFDLHHGIKSKYSDFKEYVELNDSDLFDSLEKYFPDELWSDFEQTLEYLDTDTMVDEATNYLEPYSSENWSDASHHDYQYELQKRIDTVTVDLKKHFIDWILQIEIPTTPILTLDINSIYLNFNYTSTLETVYQVEFHKILYVHNKAFDQNSHLILGHGREFNDEESFSKHNDEDTDVRVAEGNKILDEYFKETYKNTDSIITEHRDFFIRLANIEEIFVLGHSLSDVDIKYFKTIKQFVNPDTIWTVTYYGENERTRHEDTLRNIGLHDSKVRLVALKDLS